MQAVSMRCMLPTGRRNMPGKFSMADHTGSWVLSTAPARFPANLSAYKASSTIAERYSPILPCRSVVCPWCSFTTRVTAWCHTATTASWPVVLQPSFSPAGAPACTNCQQLPAVSPSCIPFPGPQYSTAAILRLRWCGNLPASSNAIFADRQPHPVSNTLRLFRSVAGGLTSTALRIMNPESGLYNPIPPREVFSYHQVTDRTSMLQKCAAWTGNSFIKCNSMG